MSTPTPTLTYALCSITGLMEGEIPQVQATQAANVWANTTGLGLVGALNVKAGTNGLDLQGVLNRLVGGTNWAVQECARRLLDLESGDFDRDFGFDYNTVAQYLFDPAVFDWHVFDVALLAPSDFNILEFDWDEFNAAVGEFADAQFDGDFD